MGLDLYVASCNEFVRELKALFQPGDIDRLRTACKEMGWESYLAGCKQNQEKIHTFLQMTPSRRRGNKAWQGKADQLLVILASIQFVLMAQNYLKGIEDNHLNQLEGGKSYRHLAGAASRAALDFLEKGWPQWPLPGENPFQTRTQNP